jgi:peptidyl-prolyl cis-trans isomerase C
MNNRYLVGGLAVLLFIGLLSIGFLQYKPAGGGDADASVDVLINEKSLPEVVATINGTPLNRTRFIGAIKVSATAMKMRGQTVNGESLKKLKQDILNHLIGSELLYQNALAEGVKVPEEKLEEEYGRLKERFDKDKSFQQRLLEQKVTLDNMKAELEKGLMINLLISDTVPTNVDVTEEMVTDFYQKNLRRFVSPQMINARHILLRLPPDAEPKIVAETENKMKEILEKLKKGKKFEDLAKKYSQGPSAPKGGDLGFFPKGAMVKEFEDVAFELQPGSAGKVVRTRFGLHYVETLEKREEGIMPLDEVRGKIFSQVQMAERNKLLQEYLKALREKADIKTFL